MTSVVIIFSSPASVNFLTAGVPAGARVTREVALAARECPSLELLGCVILSGGEPNPLCRSEMARLAPELNVSILPEIPAKQTGSIVYLRGEAMVPAADIVAMIADRNIRTADCSVVSGDILEASKAAQPLRDLRQASAAIIKATGKPGDGIISRYFNRPISQAITRQLLRFPSARPMHATVGTAILAVAMAVCLFSGTPLGLLWGAILFQAASIFDGVDGEMARATFRMSEQGAKLDSLTDAATNLAFIFGLSANLWMQGHERTALAGVAGFAMLGLGLLLIGQRTKRRNEPFTFDLIKHHFRARPSRLMTVLTWIAMRDFFAAAALVLVVADLGHHFLIGFTIVACGWLLVTVSVLFQTRRNGV